MYRQSKKLQLNSIIFSTCPSNMTKFGLLMAEIDWRVLGTPANFNGFRVLASLLHRRHSTDVNQTLYDVWPSPDGLVHYIIYTILAALVLNGILPGAKFTLRPSLAFCYTGSVTAREQWTPAKFWSVYKKMELRNFRSWLLSTEGATCIQTAAITLGIGPHSS